MRQEQPRSQSRVKTLRNIGTGILAGGAAAMLVMGVTEAITEPTLLGFSRDIFIGGALASGAMELYPRADKIDRLTSLGTLATAAICMGWAYGTQQMSEPGLAEALMGLTGATMYSGPAFSLYRRSKTL